MKYGEYLKAHLTPEWSSQYLLYEDLKDLLYDLVKRSSSMDGEFFEVKTKDFLFLFQIEFSFVKKKHRK